MVGIPYKPAHEGLSPTDALPLPGDRVRRNGTIYQVEEVYADGTMRLNDRFDGFIGSGAITVPRNDPKTKRVA